MIRPNAATPSRPSFGRSLNWFKKYFCKLKRQRKKFIREVQRFEKAFEVCQNLWMFVPLFVASLGLVPSDESTLHHTVLPAVNWTMILTRSGLSDRFVLTTSSCNQCHSSPAHILTSIIVGHLLIIIVIVIIQHHHHHPFSLRTAALLHDPW